MSLWFGIMLMTAAAVAVVLWPLRRRVPSARSGSRFEVCRIQLADIARDRAAGLIGKADAEVAFVEVSRRLLVAAEGDLMQSAALTSADWRRRLAVAAIPILLPLGTFGLYVGSGSPNLPGRPLAARLGAGVQTGFPPAPTGMAGVRINPSADAAFAGQFVARADRRPGSIDDAVALMRDPRATRAASSEVLAGRADGGIALDASDLGTLLFVDLVTRPDRSSNRRGALWGDVVDGLQSGGARNGEAVSPVSTRRKVHVETTNSGRRSKGAVGVATDLQ